jgi:DNA-binding winged helix-turn-helix (wHTH) protein
MTAGPESRTAPSSDRLVIDVDSREVFLDGHVVNLTKTEFDLLALLARNPRRVKTPEVILSELWDTDFVDDRRPVEVYIHRLRRKLGANSKASEFIDTVRGVGYRFEPNPRASTLPTKLLYDSSGVLHHVVTDSDELLGWPLREVVGTRYIPSVHGIWAQPWLLAVVIKLVETAGLESITVATVLIDKWGNRRPVRASVRFFMQDEHVYGIESTYTEVDT